MMTTMTTMTMNLLIARQSGTEIYFYHTLSVNCMLSFSGADPNKLCVFPFVYMDETFSSCTTIDSEEEVFFFSLFHFSLS